MNIHNDISGKNMENQLPSDFVINISADGTTVVSHKIRMKELLMDLLLFAVGAAGGGYLLLQKNYQFAMYFLVFAVFMLISMWMSVQKLEFSVSNRMFMYRRGPTSGKIAADDIVSLDADQLGTNERSYALVAVDQKEKSHHLFRYLDEAEAKALLGWVVRQIEE